MSSTVSILLLAAAAVLGLIYCFRGYRYLRFFMMIFGFYLGYTYISRFLGDSVLGGWTWLLALGAGVVIAALAFFFLKFTFFLAGGLLGLMLYSVIQNANPLFFSGLTSGVIFLIGLLLFLVFGILMVVAKKYLIILGTACYGSYLFTTAVGLLLGIAVYERQPPVLSGMALPGLTSSSSIFSGAAPWVPWLIIIVLALVGIVMQYRKGGGRRKRR